jgi:hypothetical protein
MNRSAIVQRINKKLAGEMLEYNELEIFLDEVIDEINHRLNSRYPVFSEFRNDTYPANFVGTDGDYNFFPENYVRSVLVVGAAYKFYLNDEEGQDTAQAYGTEYQNNLFEMQRDFIDQVPDEWRTDPMASVETFSESWFSPPNVDFWGNI